LPGFARDQLQIRDQIRTSGTGFQMSVKARLKRTVWTAVEELRQNSLYI
jgi:hypothetical protein